MRRLKKNSPRLASAKWMYQQGKCNAGSRTVNASLDALDAAIFSLITGMGNSRGSATFSGGVV
jgi:hypothetical protein